MELNIEQIKEWASMRNIAINFFLGWHEFMPQVVFWSETPQLDGLKMIYRYIYNRLIEIEASQNAIEEWVSIFSSKNLDT